jgi:ribosomal protein S18 acetylase RimI-like enzyme
MIGYVSLVFPRFKKMKGNAYLTIALKKEYRGKGIGTILMDKAEDYVRGRGARRIELEVFAKNTGAKKLYETLGYVVEGVKKEAVTDIDGYDDIVIMAKKIKKT